MFKLTNIRKLDKAASTSTTLVTCGYYISNIKVDMVNSKTILWQFMYLLIANLC